MSGLNVWLKGTTAVTWLHRSTTLLQLPSQLRQSNHKLAVTALPPQVWYELDWNIIFKKAVMCSYEVFQPSTSTKLANGVAVVLLVDCRQNWGPGPWGRNARHMVVIKTGVAEQGVYISMLPKGAEELCEGLCQSRCSVCHAPSLQRQIWELWCEAGVYLPTCLLYQASLFLDCDDWHQVSGFQQFWRLFDQLDLPDNRTSWQDTRNWAVGYNHIGKLMCIQLINDNLTLL